MEHQFKQDGAIGESWEVSGFPDQPSIVDQPDHPFHGLSLVECLEQDRQTILGTHAEDPIFPLLYKFIDAGEPLSIQVHPDAPALSKAECWVILRVEPGAEIYLGFQKPVETEEIRQRAADGSLPSLLHRIPVNVGDAFYVPPGTVHAIGRGILLAEIQQTSDTTYRLYDWNRTDTRPLHLEQAVACANLEPLCLDRVRLTTGSIPGGERLFEGPPFSVDRFRLHRNESARVHATGRFTILSAVTGSGRLEHSTGCLELTAPASCLIPALSPPIQAVGSHHYTLLAFQPVN